MITDYSLRLAENQQLLAVGAAATDHLIDLQNARNIALGEPLYAVISITEDYTAAAADDALISWQFYQSVNTTKNDIASAIELGSTKAYSVNFSGLLPRNLHKGQRISLALSPMTVTSTDTSAVNTLTTAGARYIYGVVTVATDPFTAGKFTIDICTQAMLGGSYVGAAGYSDIPVYPTGITIA